VPLGRLCGNRSVGPQLVANFVSSAFGLFTRRRAGHGWIGQGITGGSARLLAYSLSLLGPAINGIMGHSGTCRFIHLRYLSSAFGVAQGC